MDAEGRNVGDTSQYVILREALANFLMHADQFNGMSLSGVEKAVRNMKASGERPMPKACMSIAAFRMQTEVIFSLSSVYNMVHGGTTAERFAYEPGITQRPILDNYVSFRCL